MAATDTLDLLLEVTQLLGEDMRSALDGSELTVARTHLLWVLHGNGPSTQQTLAVALEVTPRNVTGLVDALVASGHVSREPHPTDRRATLVTLTEAGMAAMDEMAVSHAELARDLIESVPSDARDDFVVGLVAVVERLRVLTGGNGK